MPLLQETTFRKPATSKLKKEGAAISDNSQFMVQQGGIPVRASSSGVRELYSIAGWVLIAFGLLAAGILLFTSEMILAAIGVMLGGLVAGLPFLAIAEVLGRLMEMRDLQQEANKTNAALLEAQLRTNELLETRS